MPRPFTPPDTQEERDHAEGVRQLMKKYGLTTSLGIAAWKMACAWARADERERMEREGGG